MREFRLTTLRWGSRLIHDGEIDFYQFMVSFMGVYFSGQAAGQMFSFASSKCSLRFHIWVTEHLPFIRCQVFLGLIRPRTTIFGFVN
jgi:hypothetical protein